MTKLQKLNRISDLQPHLQSRSEWIDFRADLARRNLPGRELTNMIRELEAVHGADAISPLWPDPNA